MMLWDSEGFGTDSANEFFAEWAEADRVDALLPRDTVPPFDMDDDAWRHCWPHTAQLAAEWERMMP